MQLPGYCSFKDGIVYFPSGEINPDACTLNDFKIIVGNAPAAISGNLQNQLVYRHSLGNLRLLFSSEDEPEEKTPVVMFQIELVQPIHLGKLLKQHQADLKFMYEVVEDENGEEITVYTALFSPNFGAQFCPETMMVDTLIFVRLDHILGCKCQSCSYIRQEFGLPHPG